MTMPLTLDCDGLLPSCELRDEISRHADRLDRYFHHILACRVHVARSRRRGPKASPFSVRIDLSVPGEELVVGHDHGVDCVDQDVNVALRHAFSAALVGIEEYVRRVRHEANGRLCAEAAPARS